MTLRSANAGRLRLAFTVPAGAGDYAPEVLYLAQENRADGGFHTVHELSTFIELLETDSVLEIDILKPGTEMADIADDASWYLAMASYTAADWQEILSFAHWYGVRIRCKSGGTAGTTTISSSWW
jgi:hypothetical protein